MIGGVTSSAFALQNGHCRSPYSKIFTGAPGLPNTVPFCGIPRQQLVDLADVAQVRRFAALLVAAGAGDDDDDHDDDDRQEDAADGQLKQAVATSGFGCFRLRLEPLVAALLPVVLVAHQTVTLRAAPSRQPAFSIASSIASVEPGVPSSSSPWISGLRSRTTACR